MVTIVHIGHHRVNLIFQYKVTPGGIQVTLESLSPFPHSRKG